MEQHIRCIVNDCHYWEQGNVCRANEILVATDEFGAEYLEEVDAHLAAELTPRTAGNCMTTCCKTYIPSDSKYTSLDGVKKMK